MTTSAARSVAFFHGSAMNFRKTRQVILNKAHKVLEVIGDGKTEVEVS